MSNVAVDIEHKKISIFTEANDVLIINKPERIRISKKFLLFIFSESLELSFDDSEYRVFAKSDNINYSLILLEEYD